MKKFLALLLSLMMVLSLAACGGSDDTSDDTADPAPTLRTPRPRKIPAKSSTS